MQSERVLTRGVYEYRCDGDLFAREQWSLRQRGEGFTLIAAVERLVAEDWQIFPGSPRLNSMNISLTKDGRPSNGEIRLHFDASELIAQYRFALGGVQAAIKQKNGSVSRHELLLPRGYVPVPQPISANLFLWQVYDPANDDPQALTTYWINIFDVPKAPVSLLNGIRVDYTLAGAGNETVQVPAGTYQAFHLVQQYRNRGQELDQHGWLDEAGIPLRWSYEQDGHSWDYSVTEYEHLRAPQV